MSLPAILARSYDLKKRAVDYKKSMNNENQNKNFPRSKRFTYSNGFGFCFHKFALFSMIFSFLLDFDLLFDGIFIILAEIHYIYKSIQKIQRNVGISIFVL